MIIVLCDLIDENYKQMNLELIGKARDLAAQGREEVTALAVGAYHPNHFLELHRFGAQRILYHDVSSCYNYFIISKLVQKVIEGYDRVMMMFPATGLYRSVAAAVSVQCGGGLTADVIEIQTDENYGFTFTRAAMGASVIAEIVCINTKIQLCTVKQNVFRSYMVPLEIADSLQCEEVAFEKQDLYGERIQLIDCVALEKEKSNDLLKAKMIFSLGRGVNHADIETVREIADKYGAGVGTTRVLVEGGLMPKTRQIGQSGLTVMPNLYIAIGISGASQHIVGMRNSKKIIAINRDEKAPIFEYADYAIVDDAHTVIHQLKRLLLQG